MVESTNQDPQPEKPEEKQAPTETAEESKEETVGPKHAELKQE